jgi:hypothetical protein
MYQIFELIGYLGSLSIVGAGILYCYDKEKFQEISQTISWESVKCYHKVNNKVKNAIKNLDSNKPKIIRYDDKQVHNIKIKDMYEFYGYNIDNRTEFKCILEEMEQKKHFINDVGFDIMFMKKTDYNNKVYWKRILKKGELENIEELSVFEKVDKPFLQIEYCLKNGNIGDHDIVEKEEIHSEMFGFYIKNNKILDKIFIQWYIHKFYSQLECHEYELHIIDTNINIFKMHPNQICLLDKKEGNDEAYIIKQNEN